MNTHIFKAPAGASALPDRLSAPSRPAPRPACPAPARPAAPRARRSRVAASAVSEEEDLWQYKDRDQWYLARWAAVDQPEWNAARFVRSSQLAPGVKELVLEVEVSRERVPIRAAYKHVGQAAQVRVGGGAAVVVPPSSPPFPVDLLKDALLRVRGDMTAGEIKKAVEDGSVLSELSLLVRQADSPELFAAGGDDAFEVGPFVGTGLALRGPVAAIFQRPTLVIFCEGDGVAAARALALATPQVGGLSFKMRQDVRMYYRAPNAASLCYGAEMEKWGEELGVKVVTSTRDSFADMFDDDDTLMYEPATTAAIILTGSDNEEGEAAALAVCKEAEIEEVVVQSRGQEPTQYLTSGNPESQ